MNLCVFDGFTYLGHTVGTFDGNIQVTPSALSVHDESGSLVLLTLRQTIAMR